MEETEIRFILNGHQRDQLDAMIRDMGFPEGEAGRKEFVSTAFALTEWAVRKRKEGQIIASIDLGEGGYHELMMPALQRIKKDTTPPDEPTQN